jgi:hypothetical protein
MMPYRSILQLSRRGYINIETLHPCDNCVHIHIHHTVTVAEPLLKYPSVAMIW